MAWQIFKSKKSKDKSKKKDEELIKNELKKNIELIEDFSQVKQKTIHKKNDGEDIQYVIDSEWDAPLDDTEFMNINNYLESGRKIVKPNKSFHGYADLNEITLPTFIKENIQTYKLNKMDLNCNKKSTTKDRHLTTTANNSAQIHYTPKLDTSNCCFDAGGTSNIGDPVSDQFSLKNKSAGCNDPEQWESFSIKKDNTQTAMILSFFPGPIPLNNPEKNNTKSNPTEQQTDSLDNYRPPVKNEPPGNTDPLKVKEKDNRTPVTNKDKQGVKEASPTPIKPSTLDHKDRQPKSPVSPTSHPKEPPSKITPSSSKDGQSKSPVSTTSSKPKAPPPKTPPSSSKDGQSKAPDSLNSSQAKAPPKIPPSSSKDGQPKAPPPKIPPSSSKDGQSKAPDSLNSSQPKAPPKIPPSSSKDGQSKSPVSPTSSKPKAPPPKIPPSSSKDGQPKAPPPKIPPSSSKDGQSKAPESPNFSQPKAPPPIIPLSSSKDGQSKSPDTPTSSQPKAPPPKMPPSSSEEPNFLSPKPEVSIPSKKQNSEAPKSSNTQAPNTKKSPISKKPTSSPPVKNSEPKTSVPISSTPKTPPSSAPRKPNSPPHKTESTSTAKPTPLAPKQQASKATTPTSQPTKASSTASPRTPAQNSPISSTSKSPTSGAPKNKTDKKNKTTPASKTPTSTVSKSKPTPALKSLASALPETPLALQGQKKGSLEMKPNEKKGQGSLSKPEEGRKKEVKSKSKANSFYHSGLLKTKDVGLNDKTRQLRVQFTDPTTNKKQFIDPEFLAQYDPEIVKRLFSHQIEILREQGLYTDSEFDDMDDEIYEIILSYGLKRRKASDGNLERKKSSNMMVDTVLKDLFNAFRRQKVADIQQQPKTYKQQTTGTHKVDLMTEVHTESDGQKLNLPSHHNVTVEDVESNLLRDFSPERKAISEDRCFRLFTQPEPGDQVTIPNSFYSAQEFILESGFDPEGPLITDQVIHSKFQICLEVANMYFESLSQKRAGLLLHLALAAPNTVQGYLKQLAECVINRRINSVSELYGYLNKLHDMATGLDRGKKTESSKAEQDNFRLIQRLKKKIFSEFYRKVGFWEIKNGEYEVQEKHLRLIEVIPKHYKTGLFPFIDFISEFIANNKVVSQDQLEVALCRFLACSDGQITRQEFSDWCTFTDEKKKSSALRKSHKGGISHEKKKIQTAIV